MIEETENWVDLQIFDQRSWPKPWVRIFVDLGEKQPYRYAWGYLDFNDIDAPVFVFDVNEKWTLPLCLVKRWHEEKKRPGPVVMKKYLDLIEKRTNDVALIKRLVKAGVRL